MIKCSKFIFIFVVFIGLMASVRCGTTRGSASGRGETFGVLAFPEGIGTLLFFRVPDENFSDRIKFEIMQLIQMYGEKLRIVLIDVNERKDLVFRHRIRETPILILFDRYGTEFRRWLPEDFDVTFGKREVQRVIDQLVK